MFKNILLPLDGSTLSEASLGAASLLAERLHSPVTLLHVIEQGAPSRSMRSAILRSRRRQKPTCARWRRAPFQQT